MAALVGLLASPAGAVGNCYDAGNEAMDAGRFADAVRAFEVAAGLPECARSRAGLLHGQGYALEKQSDAGGAPTLACSAAKIYREVIGLEPTSRVAQAAQASLPKLDERCAAAQTSVAPVEAAEPIEPVIEADDSTEWGLTSGALGAIGVGGVLLVLAADAADTRDAADERALASPAGSDAEAAALADFEEASDRANVLGVTGYALLGVGGALAIGAAVAWLVPDEAESGAVRVMPTVGGVVFSGAF